MSVRRQIIAALSEDSHGGIATLADVAHAEQLVDALVAEARREDADSFERYPWHSDGAPYDNGRDAAITWVVSTLRRRADVGEKATAEAATATPDTLAHWLYLRFDKSAAPWEDVDLVDREYWEHEAQAVRRAVARGGFKTASAEEAATHDFFEPGHTYAHDVYRFSCEYLAIHPASGHRSAWGWFGKNGGWRHHSFSERQFQAREWTDITDGGASRG